MEKWKKNYKLSDLHAQNDVKDIQSPESSV